ncbi:MAG: DEAD/DEAH box helicase [Actinomycetota bacterium]
MSESTFLDLGVSAPVVEALARRSIHSPFAIQTLALPDALAGRDVLACSQTGSGKTIAFGIPIVERVNPVKARISALVLVPTRELASQVAEELADLARAKGLNVAAVYGGVPIPDQARRAARAHILVATPGRLEDLANRGSVRLDSVRVLVLDEADRMLDMGFQPQVDRIVARLPKERQTMFFSATLDGAVAGMARNYTSDPCRHEIASSTHTVDEAEHRFVPVPNGDKVEALLRLLGEKRELALIFVRTKRGADRLVEKLTAKGVGAAAMHGGMTQSARERALSRFSSGRIDALVATDVAARGLDLDSISHVINFDPPEDDRAYVHRVGRTARAGRTGTGVTLVLPDQAGDVSRIAARLQLHEEFEQEGMKVAPPRVVFRTHTGRRSMFGKRPPSRRV